jgi:hypothetical protein
MHVLIPESTIRHDIGMHLAMDTASHPDNVHVPTFSLSSLALYAI